MWDFGSFGSISFDLKFLSAVLSIVLIDLILAGDNAVVIALARQDGERTSHEEYAGLGWKYPFLGAAMALFMFSLAGIPPTAPPDVSKLHVYRLGSPAASLR